MIARHEDTELTTFLVTEEGDDNQARTRRLIEKAEGFLRTRCFTERMDDDQLRQKLALWEVRPEIPPDFQRNVWQKIAVRESMPKLPLFGNWNISWLRTPALATCFIILGGLAGTGFGLIESSQANSRNWKSLEAKYVQSIDPYEHVRTY
jgi:hypothetical protein